jgi:hypothetical protein
LKLVLIALFFGLSLLSVHAQLNDAAAGLNSTKNFDMMVLQATPTPSVNFKTNDNDPIPVYHRAGDEEVAVVSTSTATAEPMSGPSALDVFYGVFLVVYGIVWVWFVLPELGRKMRRPETDEILDTPLLKIFTLVCVIIGAIFGFLTGCNIPLQPGKILRTISWVVFFTRLVEQFSGYLQRLLLL